ncbi:MAG TPA: hypothetical protein VL588_05570 [Bdellovibrionota bacterium]|jgi:hypothetical protein|nr:hypothetical protein [Bdellovibrionota bacterium]
MKTLTLAVALALMTSALNTRASFTSDLRVTGKVESFDSAHVRLRQPSGAQVEVPRATVKGDLRPGDTATAVLTPAQFAALHGYQDREEQARQERVRFKKKIKK